MTETPPPQPQPSYDPEGSADAEKATLSRELNEFLLEFSIGVHRFAMYPEGHPSLWPSAENTLERLVALLRDRSILSIGVARNRLVIEGVATDPKHPVVGHLARRLHDHQLAAITIGRGVTAPEVRGLLEALASESHMEDRPLGLMPRDELPTWEHVKIFPVGYDQLELEGEGAGRGHGGARLTQLWIGLVQAALAQDEPLDPDSPPDPGLVAESISQPHRAAAYDQVVVGYLLDLAEQLREAKGGEVEVVRDRMSTLIEDVDEDALRRLVEMGGDDLQRQKFLTDANRSLSPGAVTKVLSASADASARPISGSLGRLLSKLALQAEAGPDGVQPQADTAVREIVEELMAGWELEDPNPGQYTLVLDAMASSSPILGDAGDMERSPERRGAGRLLMMAMEVDATGPIVEKAVSQLVDQGELGWVLEQLDQASSWNRVAVQFKKDLTTPEHVAGLLLGRDVDEDTLAYLVSRVGAAAVDPMIEALCDSEFRAIRRKVFDCLAGLDPQRYPVVEKAVDAISDSRWYVKRNMLGLLREMDIVPEGFSALPYLSHTEARVRLEAFPVALRTPESRGEAIERGLLDSDERLVRMALMTVQEGGLSNQGARIIYERFLEEGRMPELRFLAVRALRDCEAPAAREALVEVALGRRGLFGRRKLANTSSELLVAIGGLAERWSDSASARRVLRMAERSKDPEVRSAAQGRGRRS